MPALPGRLMGEGKTPGDRLPGRGKRKGREAECVFFNDDYLS